jgi:hypothetical protein
MRGFLDKDIYEALAELGKILGNSAAKPLTRMCWLK